MSIPDTAHISLGVSYILGMSFKIKVILVKKNYDKEILSNYKSRDYS